MFMPSFIRPPGRISSFEMPLELQTPDRYPTPGLMPVEPQRPVNVSITVPPSNSIFPPNSIITIGWLPAEQEIGDGDAPTKVRDPIRYEIYISRHDRWSDRIILKAQPGARQYTHLFTPPGPGRYQWHIRAIFNREMHGINSDTRSFMVLP